MEKSATCKDLLELKTFLNNIPDVHLEWMPVVCRYSDDVEDGKVDIVVSFDHEESMCELVGSSNCV